MTLDKAYFIASIQNNSTETFDLVKSISKSQLEVKPEKGWGVLENLEHIFLTEKLVYLMLCRPSNQMADNTFAIGEKTLEQKIVTNRQHKLAAPESLQPKGKIKSIADFFEQYTALREQLTADLNKEKIIIDNRIYKHIYLGEMTVADWLVFIVYHNQRHLLQIKELL